MDLMPNSAHGTVLATGASAMLMPTQLFSSLAS